VRGNFGEAPLSIWRGQDYDGKPALGFHLHPTAESVDIIGVGRGRVLASAKTSTTGPGYHLYVCDLLRRLGRALEVTWDPPCADDGSGDETGYFHSGDRSGVEREMLKWLQAMARMTLSGRADEDGVGTWCLPIGHRYKSDGAVLTATGPRDTAWLEMTAEDPRRGIDFFSWWDEGTGAPYHLGRALCEMWMQVRWRPPLIDAETDLLNSIANELEAAHRLDPALDYPWPEWHEVLRYLETDSLLAAEVARRAAQQPNGPSIGYRRRNVAVELTGGWSIEVPGSLAECWDEDGTWQAWDSARSVSVSLLSSTANGNSPSAKEALSQAPLPAEGEPLEYRGADVIGRAVLEHGTKEGPSEWLLTAASAVAGRLALLTICYEDPADRPWAINTWQSLAHRSPQPA
jgi:hypothetical protein